MVCVLSLLVDVVVQSRNAKGMWFLQHYSRRRRKLRLFFSSLSFGFVDASLSRILTPQWKPGPGKGEGGDSMMTMMTGRLKSGVGGGEKAKEEGRR